MSQEEESIRTALCKLGHPCTLHVLRDVLVAQIGSSGIPLQTGLDLPVGRLLKLRRRLGPQVDPGGTPLSMIATVPSVLTRAGFQDLEDIVELGNEGLPQVVRIPKGTVESVLTEAKRAVGLTSPCPLDGFSGGDYRGSHASTTDSALCTKAPTLGPGITVLSLKRLENADSRDIISIVNDDRGGMLAQRVILCNESVVALTRIAAQQVGIKSGLIVWMT
ncbi:hypothetical protein Pelo_4915 [Pelomyxa schiedti]|nr:hypothetical protein Pelo_4915 [Pelomyxa schiedti]